MSLLLLPPPTPGPNLIALVTDSVHSPHTKRAYRDALLEFFAWYQTSATQGFCRAIVQRYRCILEDRHLSPSAIKVRLAAVRRLASEMADQGLLDPHRTAGILKVKGPARRGVRMGNWLTLPQAEELLGLPDISTTRGKRDRALLTLLLGAGLRRAEAAGLTFEHIQQR